MTRARPLIPLLLVFVLGCGDDGGSAADASSPPDARIVDATAVSDAPPADAAMFPLAGFGTLSGECDVLDTELIATEPSAWYSAIDFAQGYTKAVLSQLTAGGQKIIADDNAGGSSLYSEVFAFELLQRCELATLLKTENEIIYATPGKITDLLVDMDGVKLGVSVTRAVSFPFDDPFPVAQAQTLLTDKLSDILESTANVSAADRWQKQLLVVVAYAPGHASSLMTALANVDSATRADTVVWVLVSNGDDSFLYCDGVCASP